MLRQSHALWLLLLVPVAGCRDLEAVPQVPLPPALPAPAVTLPAWTGEWAVGRYAERVSDPSRNRELQVMVYYPAVAPAKVPESVLMDSTAVLLHTTELAQAYGMTAAQSLRSMLTVAGTGTAMASLPTPPPVLLFAPGHRMLPTDYSALLEGLASRGFVVIAVASPGVSGRMRLEDGTVAVPGEADGDACATVADDLAFIRRSLISWDGDPSWPFAHRLNLLRVGVFGQGLGGAAAVLAASNDSAFFAAAMLGGDFVGRSARGGATQPLLWISGQPDGTLGQPMVEWASSDRSERRRLEMWGRVSEQSRSPLHVRVAGLSREGFSDIALLPRAVRSAGVRSERGQLGGADALQLEGALVAEFFADAAVGTHGGVATVVMNHPEARLQPTT